jgi:hypothetical protein
LHHAETSTQLSHVLGNEEDAAAHAHLADFKNKEKS